MARFLLQPSKGTETLAGKCLYADDLAMFYSAKATEIIKRKIQGGLDTLVKIANSIGFSISATKTT